MAVEAPKKRKTVQLPAELAEEIQAIRHERGWSESLILREALIGWLAHYRQTGHLSMKGGAIDVEISSTP